eukprot:235505-Rhodomonas_salina.1
MLLRVATLVAAGLSLAFAIPCDDVEVNLPCTQHSYSSVLQNSARCSGFALSTLDGPSAWQSARNGQGQWLQLDLLERRLVYGAVTQCHGTTLHCVRKYKFMYSQDGSSWQWVDGGRQFDGNGASLNGNLRKRTVFGNAVFARYIRIVPTA